VTRSERERKRERESEREREREGKRKRDWGKSVLTSRAARTEWHGGPWGCDSESKDCC
jgi:hypothetical protein